MSNDCLVGECFHLFAHTIHYPEIVYITFSVSTFSVLDIIWLIPPPSLVVDIVIEYGIFNYYNSQSCLEMDSTKIGNKAYWSEAHV